MSMAGTMPEDRAAEPREFRIRNFIIASVLLHALLFLSAFLTFGGIFGGPGPGGGEAVTFQLAAGSANDRYAAPPKPVEEPKPEVKPEPPKPPEPKKQKMTDYFIPLPAWTSNLNFSFSKFSFWCLFSSLLHLVLQLLKGIVMKMFISHFSCICLNTLAF